MRHLHFESTSFHKSSLLEISDSKTDSVVYVKSPLGFFGCIHSDPFWYQSPISSFPSVDSSPDSFRFINIATDSYSELSFTSWWDLTYESEYRGIAIEWQVNWCGTQITGRIKGHTEPIFLLSMDFFSVNLAGEIVLNMEVFRDIAQELGIDLSDQEEKWQEGICELEAFLVLVGLTVFDHSSMAARWPDYDLNAQTFTLPNSKKPGQTAIYRNLKATYDLKPDDGTGVRTLYENFRFGLTKNPTGRFLGFRPFDRRFGQYSEYQWESYQVVAQRIVDFSSGIVHLYKEYVNSKGEPFWHLGIYSINRPEWVIADLAATFQSLVTVALYDTLGEDTLEYILNHAEIRVIVASADKIPGILRIAEKLPFLKAIISMDELEEALPPIPGSATASQILRSWAEEKKVQLYSFKQVEELGQKFIATPRPPQPDDLATICYTSGTTGNPKGAMITHWNLVSSTISLGVDDDLKPNEEDVLISYLPLAHIYERMNQVVFIRYGSAIGFFRGDPLLILEDMAELQPTVFPTVPRLLNRVYDKVTQATIHAPGFVGVLSRRAVAAKLENLDKGILTHALWDRLLFNKIRKLFGGRIRLIGVGSAPTSPEVLKFTRIVFGCPVLEGYGQTENCAASCVTVPGDDAYAGHVGVPNSCLELKLVDVPEMQYLATDMPDPRGEICFRGSSVFIGYYKDPEKTKEAIDEDGWLHSGDIGKIDSRGVLHIIDRKKNIFKLSQGEYIAPDKLENVYITLPLLMQIYIHGDSLQSHLVAIVVPEPESFIPWAEAVTSRTGATLKELCQDKIVEKALLQELDIIAKARKLNGFEFIKDIRLEPEQFTISNGLLTPTLKLKRTECAKFYRDAINEMYSEIQTKKATADDKLAAKL